MSVRTRLLTIAPFAVFAALAVVFALQLKPDVEDASASPMVGKLAPASQFDAFADRAPVAPDDLRAGPVLVNFWASWCAPCRIEHPHLLALKRAGVRIIGVDYKDDADKASKLIKAIGDPYTALVRDPTGRASLDWGITGVPETFVIDRDGRIVAHMRSPITAETIDAVIAPALAKAGAPLVAQALRAGAAPASPDGAAQ